jgi:hypothetical protein
VTKLLRAAGRWLGRTISDIRQGLPDGFDALWYG